MFNSSPGGQTDDFLPTSHRFLVNWDLPLLGVFVAIIPSFGTVGLSRFGGLLTGLRVLVRSPVLHSPGRIARGRRDVGASHGKIGLSCEVDVLLFRSCSADLYNGRLQLRVQQIYWEMPRRRLGQSFA